MPPALTDSGKLYEAPPVMRSRRRQRHVQELHRNVRGVVMAVVIAAGMVVVPPAATAATVGSVSATPTTGLGWRTNVTVTITSAPALATLRILECYWDIEPDGGCSTIGMPTTDAAGAATAIVTTLRSVHDEEGGGDCWSPRALRCELAVFAPDVGLIGERIPITFDTSTPPPPPPSVAVTPTSGLPAESLLSVHLDGLLAFGSVQLEQCTSEVTMRCRSAGSGQADAHGMLDAELVATRLIGAFPFDCATAPTPCFARVSSEGPNVETVPLFFDPTAPLPPRPSVDVSPTDHLADGQTVTISGRGFTASNLVAFAVCAADVRGTDDCDTQHFGAAPTGIGGSFASTLNVHSVIITSIGRTVDCRRAPGTCVLAVATFSDLSQTAVVPLTFLATGPDPTLTIEDVTVPEGTGGSGLVPVPVPITLSVPSESPVVVAVSAHDRSATRGLDYVAPLPLSAVIPAGLMHGTVTVYVNPDALDELTERFVLTVDSVAGAKVQDGTGSIRITDDDPAPDVMVDDAIVSEANGTASVAVRLSAPSGRTVTVDYSTHHGSARAGRDYVRTRGYVMFAPGTTVQTVSVPIVDDRIHEGTEGFRLQVDEPDHGRLADANATIWIGDDD